jgi:ribosome biogenesis GTPase A
MRILAHSRAWAAILTRGAPAGVVGRHKGKAARSLGAEAKRPKTANPEVLKKSLDPAERRLTSYYKNYRATKKTVPQSIAAKPKVPPKLEKPDVQVMQSNTPTVFLCPPLDPDVVDFSRWTGKAEYLFSLKKEYVHPSVLNYELPKEERPEFAFIGRSNVGKSSLIGALLGSKGLVKVSKEPGCYQL